MDKTVLPPDIGSVSYTHLDVYKRQAYGIEESRIAFSSSYFGTLDNSSRDVSVVLGVSLLIAVACATVIYSLFYVSVTGKIKEYGRLRVIGMTQKQVRLSLIHI